MLGFHALLVFFEGGKLTLAGPFAAPFPLLCSGVVLGIFLLWSGVALLRGAVRAPGKARWLHLAGVTLLAAGAAPFVVLPGGIYCYPLSDAGFRLLVGDRLQEGVVSWLRLPDSAVSEHSQYGNTVKTNAVPPCLRELGIPYSLLEVSGDGPGKRRLQIINGIGIAQWGLLVGEPQFRVGPADAGARKMWDGVYAFRNE